jgi:hypothetical protein
MGGFSFDQKERRTKSMHFKKQTRQPTNDIPDTLNKRSKQEWIEKPYQAEWGLPNKAVDMVDQSERFKGIWATCS